MDEQTAMTVGCVDGQTDDPDHILRAWWNACSKAIEYGLTPGTMGFYVYVGAYMTNHLRNA